MLLMQVLINFKNKTDINMAKWNNLKTSNVLKVFEIHVHRLLINDKI